MFGKEVQAEDMLLGKFILGFHDILSIALLMTGREKSATNIGGFDRISKGHDRQVLLMNQVADPVPPDWKQVAEMPVKAVCIPGPV